MLRGRWGSAHRDEGSQSEPPLRPGQLYRDAVRSVCTSFKPEPGADPSAAFLVFLEKWWTEERTHLQQLLSRRLAAAEEIYGTRMAVMVAAAGLVAHGRIDAIHDVFECTLELGEGKPRPNIRRLARVLSALLPLPEGLDPETDPERFRTWMGSHEQRLIWDPDQDRYGLREESHPR